MLPTPIRIKFTKTGALQFISHLDLNRTMKTVMIRAKIPIHYSEGFNPCLLYTSDAADEL